MGDRVKYLLGGLFCGLVFCPLAHAQDQQNTISSGIPDEFRDLVEPDFLDGRDGAMPPVVPIGAMFAELYVDGVRRGDVIAELDGETLRFDNSAQAVSQIPDAHNSDALIELLGRGFLVNDGRLCIVRPGARCSPPRIGTLALVINPQIPRIDLFRSQRYILPPEPIQPSHPDQVGLLASFTGRVSGRTGDGSDSSRGSLTFDVVGGMGATSAFTTGSLIDDGDLSVRNGGIQHFSGRHRIAGGLFLADASDHFSQINVVGAQLHTTDLTRPSSDSSRDTPLLIFLDQDSYVDVLRGGELLFSQQLGAGPVRIPTRNFPGGSYNVEILIRDQAGNTSTEDRFFSRSNDFSQVNQWEYGIQAGITRSQNSNRFGFQETGLGYFSLRASRQIARRTQVGGRAGMIGDVGFVESFAEQNFGRLFLRGSGLMTSDGGYSFSTQLSGRIEQFSISGRVRHSDFQSNVSAFRGQSARNTELNSNISREVPLIGGQVSGFARYIDRADQAASTSWGATWTKNVPIFSRRSTGLFNVGYQRTERDHRFLVGFRINWQGRRTSASGNMRHQIVRGRSSGQVQTQTTQDARVSLRSKSGSLDRWSLTGRASHLDDGNGSVSVSGQLQTGDFFVDGRADRNFGDDQALNYFGSLSTTLAVSPNGIGFTGSRNVDAGVMVNFDGADSDERIEVRMNRGTKRNLSSGISFIPVTPFLPQDVSFRPDRTSSIGYNNAATRISAFPGNIISIDPELFKQVAVFGRLVDGNGNALSNHIIQLEDQSFPTDDGGYFVFDIRLEIRTFIVRKNGTNFCEVELPELAFQSQDQVIGLGDLECRET